MPETTLTVEPLTAQAFAEFGDVIEAAHTVPSLINDGTCERYDDLATVDVLADCGRALISLFHARARILPLRIQQMERHPLSSQAFFPLDRRAFLVAVASAGDVPLSAGVRVFLASGRQGVNYRRNTWHHALMAIQQDSRFLVVDRGGPGDNCEERAVEGPPIWITVP